MPVEHENVSLEFNKRNSAVLPVVIIDDGPDNGGYGLVVVADADVEQLQGHPEVLDSP